MGFLKKIALTLYRIWFYILLAVPIVVLSPFLIVSISRQQWYPFFFRLARIWAKIILFGMGFYPIIKREELYKKGQSYMFVANHTSMTDIMLMLYVSRNPFVFVGKAELAKIPIFGFFYKRTCILVDRKNPKSRRDVFIRAQKKLNQGLGVCIFPEGGVPDDENVLLDIFKDGAFRLAIEHKIPIAPMTFHDNKKRFSYTFFSGGPGKMRVKVHKTIPTGILELEDKRMLNNQVRNVILKELESPTI
ncbi:lysophospholipid acyltransferase family protein [Marinirhabdus gelatinilytica]|uniref:1-acyl-sn-glycerol-3-phosphate acyltransferase n=1 Tax=Marinirhabdus gelatinilytica TaxID=1703343 RepID=A0A370QJL2_9FLAO|nr:lysophospholipid acyltransferase family protein [Marinirhabdus gelatinilytica]RDK88563.1 1-acyl-sn-glycerol-3-phosphate acyltransferase [Marinirhabdus gelatinilytica]